MLKRPIVLQPHWGFTASPTGGGDKRSSSLGPLLRKINRVLFCRFFVIPVCSLCLCGAFFVAAQNLEATLETPPDPVNFVAQNNPSPSRRPNSAGSKTRQPQRRGDKRAENKSPAHSTDSEDLVVMIFKLLGGMFLCGFFIYQFRSSRKSSFAGEDVGQANPSSIRYIPPSKPLVLRHQGIDPATMEQSSLIRVKSPGQAFRSKIGQKLNSLSKMNQRPKKNGFHTDSSQSTPPNDPFAEAVSLFGPHDSKENDAISFEISSITDLSHDLGKSESKSNLSRRPHPPTVPPPFPKPISEHYTPQPREKLLWHKIYSQGSNEGLMVITNQRVLHVYQRRVLKIFPPGLEFNFEKCQHPLLSLRIVRRHITRKNVFLVLAAPFVFWFPYGTLLSALLGIVYGVWTRQEIAIGVRPDRLKSYPLPEATQDEFIAILKKIRSRRILGRKKNNPPKASSE